MYGNSNSNNWTGRHGNHSGPPAGAMLAAVLVLAPTILIGLGVLFLGIIAFS